MRSICTTAAISIKPWKRKTAKIATKFLDDAAQQVAGELPQGRELTRSDIEGYLRSLTDLDRNWVLPIYEVGFVPADETESELGKPYDYDLIIVRWEADRRDTKSDTNSIDKFVKRVQKFLN